MNSKYELLANGYGKFDAQAQGVYYEGNFTHNFFHDQDVAKLIIQQLYKYEGSFSYGKRNGWGTLHAYQNLKEFKVLFSGMWVKNQPVDGYYYQGDQIMRVESGKIVKGPLINKEKLYVIITQRKAKGCQLLGEFNIINLNKSRKADKQDKLKEIQNEQSIIMEETTNSNILSEEIEINEEKIMNQQKNIPN